MVLPFPHHCKTPEHHLERNHFNKEKKDVCVGSTFDKIVNLKAHCCISDGEGFVDKF